MAKIKAKVTGKGNQEDPLRVNLPTYTMIAGTEEYKAGKLVAVQVEVPEDECTDGQLDKAKIRAKYRGQPLWDREDVLSDI